MTASSPDHTAVRAGAVQTAALSRPLERHLELTAFDATTADRGELRALLAELGATARSLVAGHRAPGDTGEADGLGDGSLSIELGLGAALFHHPEHGDRFGLAPQRPHALSALDQLPRAGLDPARSDGDISVQIRANDPQVAFHALHTLTRVAHTAATPRWSLRGFQSPPEPGESTPRNLMGFKDGTANVGLDTASLRRHVLVAAGEQPHWMAGGTYVVIRRIRTLLDVWDATSVEAQERTIGRHKHSGAPLGSRAERDPLGPARLPANAHARLASADANNGARILRRAFNYHDGIDPDTGQLDAGLIFIAYQRDPATQFVPIQRRLAASDALNHHIVHTTNALFAIPAAPPPHHAFAARLFA